MKILVVSTKQKWEQEAEAQLISMIYNSVI